MRKRYSYRLNQLKYKLTTAFLFSVFILSAQNTPIQGEAKGQRIEIDSVTAQRTVTIGDLLRGKSAGVSVIQGDGALGSAFDVLVRGGASLRGSNQPIYIMDGVILNPSHLDVPNAWESVDGSDYQAVQNLLWAISSTDIESVEVLKDAAATAIYGSKGANGVVIIKSKSGKGKEKQVTWTSNFTLSSASKKIDFLQPSQFESYYQTLTGTPFSKGTSEERNWQDEILGTSFSHNHAFSMQGSLRRTNYYVSLNASQKEGIIAGTGTTDLGMRANINQTISPRINMEGRFVFLKNSASMTQSTSLLGATSLITDLSAVPFSSLGENPESWSADYDDNSDSWRAIPQAAMQFKLTDGVDLNVNGGVDFVNKVRFCWMGNLIDKGALDNSRAGRSELTSTNYNVNAILSINKQLGQSNTFKMNIGGEYFGDTYTSMANYGADFSIYSMRAKGISFASKSANAVYVQSASSTVAAFANTSYSFKNKYKLDVGIRADYLIDFDTRYYPSVTGKWNISEEDFWKEKLSDSFISSASVEAGWGISGKNEVTSFSNIEKYSLGYGTLWIPYEEVLYFKPRIETIKNELFGAFNLELFDKKLKFGGKYYYSNIDDILSIYNFRPDYTQKEYDDDGVLVNSNLITFDNLYWQNAIGLKKWGVEGYADAIPLKTNSLEWKIGVNFAIDRTTVTDCGLPEWNKLGKTDRAGFTGASVSGTESLGVTAFVNGSAPNIFYGYLTQGLVGEEHVGMTPPFKGQRLEVGDPKFIDTNGNGQVEEGDKVVIGNPNPDFTFGITNSFRVGKFTFNALFDGMVGNDILNLNRLSWDNVSQVQNVTQTAYNNRWIQGDVSGKSPRIGAYGLTEITDNLVEDGSFIRLSNLSADYAVDVNKIKWLSALNVNVFASNLFVITKYSGYSPDVNSFVGNWSTRGIDLGAYPQARTFSLGFTAKF